MLKNYITIAIRNLMRHKLYSVINIAGLAVGMACCILILLFVRYELSYDRFHENADRIYRVVRETRTTIGTTSVSPGTSGLLAGALERDFPEVEVAIRTMQGSTWVRYENKGFEQRFCVADPKVLEIFHFPLVKGHLNTALQERFSVLITEEAAKIFFGDSDPIGKVITAEGRYYGGDYTITGVLKDLPLNSSIRFDFLSATMHQAIPLLAWEQWQPDTSWRPVQTYVLLAPNATAENLESKLPELMTRYMGKEVQAFNAYFLQPFTRIHLHSEADYEFSGNGDITQVYIFLTIAVFVLMIACINFMNLATARSTNRAREIGLRKVVGASKGQLVQQFLGEAILLAFFALLLALGLMELALPRLSSFTNYHLILNQVYSGELLLWMLGTGVLVGLLAGCYPAFFLSSFQPVVVLKSSIKMGNKGLGLRRCLVVFQFAISIVLIIGTVVVYHQLAYTKNKNLGFNRDLIVVLPLFTIDRSLTTNYEAVKQAFLAHPNVLKASASNSTIAWGGGDFQTVQPQGLADSEWQMRMLRVDEDFLETYEIALVDGRNFSRDIPTDATEAYILNETAVQQLGWTDPIGKSFEWVYWQRKGQVIGVVKDFHNRSLKEPILPLALCMMQAQYNFLSLKIRPDHISDTMVFLEQVWQRFIPNRPFSATFLDDHLAQVYQSERRFGHIFQIFAILAIFVASLGLFGLISFTVKQRSREIGIRKVLGASAPGIVLMLSKDFVKLVLIANLIAWPVAYYTMSRWLENFAYRIDLGWEVFVLSGGLALLIALLTVSGQAWKAARANPVDALRNE